ncbi:MAG: hypothetical protein NTW25_13315 [Candidatus Kapabacteria bacterium]|nr:hypothetical protein [Candidatus Kapabacteria bacterium]
MTIDQILDEVELLPNEELLMFNEIVSNRVKDIQRKELIENVMHSRLEYKNGLSKVSSVDDIMKELM